MSKPRRANPAIAHRQSPPALPAGAQPAVSSQPAVSTQPAVTLSPRPAISFPSPAGGDGGLQEIAVQAAVQRLSDPLRQMLLWCTALRGNALPEICELVGLTNIDLDAYSAEHRQKIQELRTLECFGELCGREQLARLLRAAVGKLLLQYEDPQLALQGLRAAARLPGWAFEPELAAEEAALKQQEIPVRYAELRARRAEATTRRVNARSTASLSYNAGYVNEEWPVIPDPEIGQSEPFIQKLGQEWAT